MGNVTKHDSEQQLYGHLQLPRIEHRSGSPEKRIRNGRPSRGATADLNCLDRAACRVLVLAGLLPATQIVSAVDANDLVHIHTVEQVEGIDGEFEPGSLLKIDRAREADVPRLKAVALVRIAREIPNAIGSGDEVVVGIEAHKQCERPRALKDDDIAQQEVPQERV